MPRPRQRNDARVDDGDASDAVRRASSHASASLVATTATITSVNLRAFKLSAVPTEVLTLRNLKQLDLACNQLSRFPGDIIARELVKLEALDLQHNVLYILEDIIALSVAPRLKELNFLHNPMRLLHNRIYLIEAFVRGA